MDFKTFEIFLDMHIDGIPDLHDKVKECKYFLELAGNEVDIQKFRWLSSAFLSAAYSYFEIKAVEVWFRCEDVETGEVSQDQNALEILNQYVESKKIISRNKKEPSVQTNKGRHELVDEFRLVRNKNTHHSPLFILSDKDCSPESFKLLLPDGKTEGALAFLRKVFSLIEQVEGRLEKQRRHPAE